MDPIASLPLTLALLLLGLTLILTWLHHARAVAKRLPAFRPLPGIDLLSKAFDHVAETGRAIHVATGSNHAGRLGSGAESFASLQIAQTLAQESVRRGGTIAVTAGDAVDMFAARGVVHQAYYDTGFADNYPTDSVQLTAHQEASAYALGVAARLADVPIEANVIAGNYGAELLLTTEPQGGRRVSQLAITPALEAAPTMMMAADAILIGEELFAVEAYLSEAPTSRARLLTQDGLRRAVIVIIVLGILYQLAAMLLGVGLPAL